MARSRASPEEIGRLMRITIVMGAFIPMPPGPAGAVEQVWYHLARQFARQGHEVTVICRGHEGQADRETIDDVRYLRVTRFGRSGRVKVDLLKDLAYSLRVLPLVPPGDIVVTNAFWLPAMLGRLRGGRGNVVMNVQRVPKGQYRMYGNVACLAAVSTAIRDAIVAEHPGAASRVTVIPNPFNTDVFTPPPLPRPRTEGTRTILYTGRIHPEKGLHVLVEAFRQVAGRFEGLKLRLVGPFETNLGGGGEAYVRQLRELAGDRPVELPGGVFNQPGLAAELRDADYYCYPSLAEKGDAFPVAPLEAMGTGLTPVVSDLGCFRDLIEDRVDGRYFDHRGPAAAANLAGTLSELISDPARTAAMGQRAAGKAAGYSYGAVAGRYLSCFNSLLFERG